MVDTRGKLLDRRMMERKETVVELMVAKEDFMLIVDFFGRGTKCSLVTSAYWREE